MCNQSILKLGTLCFYRKKATRGTKDVGIWVSGYLGVCVCVCACVCVCVCTCVLSDWGIEVFSSNSGTHLYQGLVPLWGGYIMGWVNGVGQHCGVGELWY